MIHNTTLDGRPVKVLFLNSAFEPVEQADATLVRVNFMDAEGGSMFLVPDKAAKKFDPNQPREPAGGPGEDKVGGMITRPNTELIDELAQQTGAMSSSAQMASAPAYTAILNIGQPAVPDLLTALSQGKAVHPVMMLLRSITGANPVPKEHRGNTEAMISDWLAWGEST